MIDWFPARRTPVRDGMTIGGVIVAAYLTYAAVVLIPAGVDAHAYWSTALDHPYVNWTAGSINAYLYSPAFLQALAPLKLLPWPVFQALITGLMAGLVVATWRPWSPIVLLLPPITLELANANIDILLGLACLAALRWPAAWALPLLTKVTPGVGLVWFAVRREWRQLGIAALATAVIVVASALAGGDWAGWIEALTRNGTATPPSWVVPVPLAVRVVAAGLLVAWGARTDRRWTVVVGGMVALPALGFASLSFLVGLGPLLVPWSSNVLGNPSSGHRPLHEEDPVRA